MKYRFQATLNNDSDQLYDNHIIIPNEISDELISSKNKRCMCSIDGDTAFHTGLISNGKGNYFIIINKTKVKKYNLATGRICEVTLTEDTSEYGINLPDEMAEMLQQDPDASQYFHNLTPGKQRSLLYLVDKVKSPKIRLTKALIITEHLKENRGVLDYKKLHQDLKNKKDILK